MSKIFNLTFFILLVGLTAVYSQTDRRIVEIQRIYQETIQKVTECETNGEYSTTFLTEMVVNKNNGSYPAVGIYKTTAKFYYTYGDREKNPYPNRLMKIVLTVNRSSNTENSEFLFDEKGSLIFYFEKKEEAARRVYLTLGKPVRVLEGEKNVDLKSKQAVTLVQQINGQSQKLTKIFQNSLED